MGHGDASQPTAEVRLSGAALDSALEAVADFIDLKSPFTLGHSRGVADLAAAAARDSGLPNEEVVLLRRAGLVHDLGRLGVPNTIWDKPGPLTPPELERVHLHAYLTERTLSFSPALRTLGAIAALHHERLDGSGYPKGLTGDAIGPSARLLAAADCYHALREPRPHRPARAADEAAAVITDEVRAGKLDSHTVDAVLRAAGHAPKRRRTWPAGLTTREVEVLRLQARGFSHREIAEQLADHPPNRRPPHRARLSKDRSVQPRPRQPVRDQTRARRRHAGPRRHRNACRLTLLRDAHLADEPRCQLGDAR